MAKIGFVFSGASAFIAQEAALCFALTQGHSPLQRKIRPDVIAGTSSGALNAVVLNAILRTQEGQAPAGREFYWGFDSRGRGGGDPKNNYFSLLSRITNSQVFRWRLSALQGGGVLDNSPLRRLLERVVNQTLGMETLGDLYLPTYLTAVERSTGKTQRFCSVDPEHADLDLVDVLMASAAIPVVFPPQKIHRRAQGPLEGLFFDGGTGSDSIPVEALAQEGCDEIYLINRTGSTEGVDHRPKPEKDPTGPLEGFHLDVVENALISLEYLFQAINKAQLRRATEIAASVYLYEPILEEKFSILDFGTEKAQWLAAWDWAQKNSPQLLLAQVPPSPLT